MIKYITDKTLFTGSLVLLLLLFPQWESRAGMGPEPSTAKLTYLYGDREPEKAGLQRAFGLATLIDFDGKKILFDTGGDETVLKKNMEIMGIDPAELDLAVISHHHWEMTGGAEYLLQRKPELLVISTDKVAEMLTGYNNKWKNIRKMGESVLITPNIFLIKLHSGLMQGGPLGIEEIHMILRTREGLAILEGCGHPGVLRIMEESRQLLKEKRVYLLSGGTQLLDRGHKVTLPGCDSQFHQYILGKMPKKSMRCDQDFTIPQPTPYADEEIIAIADGLLASGIQRIIPTLCTGERPENIFAARFKEKYVSQKLGMVLPLPGPPKI
ncbi:MAG: MBL fold metallo-hydrolase [Desulfobulbaceae bacterium]|nr:MBL fold metallo-hydrolase [Desulfobulbaceae bacterium]